MLVADAFLLGDGWMSETCPECVGALFYDPPTRSYVCRSCGLVYTRQELLEHRSKLSRVEDERERRERERREYLEWWLSKKR